MFLYMQSDITKEREFMPDFPLDAKLLNMYRTAGSGTGSTGGFQVTNPLSEKLSMGTSIFPQKTQGAQSAQSTQPTPHQPELPVQNVSAAPDAPVEKSYTRGNASTYTDTSNWKTTKNPSGGYTKTNPAGTMSVQYDANGREVGGVMNGSSFTTSYSANGGKTRTLNNGQMRVTYDASGRETGGSKSNGYWFISQTDQKGNTIRYWYDASTPGNMENASFQTEIIDNNGITYCEGPSKPTINNHTDYRLNGSYTDYTTDSEEDIDTVINYDANGRETSAYINGMSTTFDNTIYNDKSLATNYNKQNTDEKTRVTNPFRSAVLNSTQYPKANPADAKIGIDAVNKLKLEHINDDITTRESYPANGKIDMPFVQTYEGDCWALSAINAILLKPNGREYLNTLIKYDSQTGSVKVTLPGVNFTYTVSAEELASSKYADVVAGDNDVRAILIAMDKYLESQGQKPEAGSSTVIGNGGYETDAWKMLMRNCTVEILTGGETALVQPADFNRYDRVYSISFKKGCMGLHPDGKMHKLQDNHAYTVVKADSKYIYLLNPWGFNEPDNYIKVPIENYQKYTETVETSNII